MDDSKSLYRKWLEITKHPFINGCFNWMIPNLYIENGCFTKHPFINGWPWGSRYIWYPSLDLGKISRTKTSTKIPKFWENNNQNTKEHSLVNWHIAMEYHQFSIGNLSSEGPCFVAFFVSLPECNMKSAPTLRPSESRHCLCRKWCLPRIFPNVKA